jgi:hypothetical protein
MSAESLMGKSIASQIRCVEAQVTAFPVNTTSIVYVLTVPTSLGSIRITDIQWVASAVLSDADGTCLVSVLARDATEGADDTLVNAVNIEGGTAHIPASFTLITESAERELTLDPGDSLRVTFTGNSAAIDTNGAVGVFVYFHPIPKEDAGDDIRHASFYR